MRVNMIRGFGASLVASLGALGVVACSGLPSQQAVKTIDIKIIAFNDLHGNLEPPRLAVPALRADGTSQLLPAGGAAYLANAVKSLRAQNPNHAVVSAGDMVGASPLVSALFLDEPTIEVANAIGLDFNAVGNHEFDKGASELLRLGQGGCTKWTALEPCQISKPFAGAKFGFLAANVVRASGDTHDTLFPAYGFKTFGEGDRRIKLAFIGMTLKDTPSIVTPTGVAGLSFKNEADTANALVPKLLAEGADAIVVLLHQGGVTQGAVNPNGCEGFAGDDIRAILSKLDPRISVVISGHTHRSYICNYPSHQAGANFLLTSAGQYGTLLTSIDLQFDAASKRLINKSAHNIVVQSEAFQNAAGQRIEPSAQWPLFAKDAEVEAIVQTYRKASSALTQRVAGTLAASLTRMPTASGESALGNLIADAQLSATQSPERGGAQIALMNPGGVRADLIPAPVTGEVTYGQLFSAQPFGNSLVVKTLLGSQIKAILEQQFVTLQQPRVLYPSHGFGYTYDLSQPAGNRVSRLQLHGKAVDMNTSYRVTMNSFLASGGDGFTSFKEGQNPLGGDLDVDALSQYLAQHPRLAAPDTARLTKK